MTGCTLISSAGMYALLNCTRDNFHFSWALVAVGSAILLVKIPAFPFSVWLPEAHVEASWPGSVVLAGFALKFSVVALLSFASVSIARLDFCYVVLLFSVAFSALAMCSTSDAKKLVANFSVVHMGVTMALLFLGVDQEFFLNFSWHHHSLVTGGIFVMIGWTYASTSSRLFRLLVGDGVSLVLFVTTLLAIFTLSLDLPWTSNFFIELNFFRSCSSLLPLLPVFFVFFWVVVVGYVILATSRTARSFLADLTTSLNSLLFGFCCSAVILGFGTRRSRR
jgi:NADH:ubiquinone oxidoreductase subunit 4 (subunit M)